MSNADKMLAAAHRMHNSGKPRDAEILYRKILAQNPRHPGALNGLGVALLHTNRFDEAQTCLERLSRILPQIPEPYNNLGLVATAQGRTEDALTLYRMAVEIAPTYSDALINLARALITAKQTKESIRYFEQLVRLGQANPDILNDFAYALLQEERPDEAIAQYRKALEVNPEHTGVLGGLSTALWAQGRTDECIASLRRALEIDPNQSKLHSSLLFYSNYSSTLTPEERFQEHLRWGDRHATPLSANVRPHTNVPDPDRPLRIGYVSADFLRHVASLYIAPLLAAHDRREVQVFCYANVANTDFMTLRMKNRADTWRDVWGMDDEAMTELIRSDQIDILVDLNGHTSKHRLLAFARKPAPVQVTWLGYFNTTGVRAIDYRFTDPYALPPDADRFSVEELVRLPVASCYFPPAYCPPVGPLPARRNGWITFGSSNNPGKVSNNALSAWADVLKRVPESRLQINYPSLRSVATRQQIGSRLAQHGIDKSRVNLLHTTHEENLASYNNVDISLDSFPFNGSTTTVESLWMGVPVITMYVPTMVSSFGMSILTLAGQSEFITHSPDEYVETAARLAGDLDRLEGLRSRLRERIVESPLTNMAGFTASVEAAYRWMWRRWCSGAKESGKGELFMPVAVP